MIRTNCCIDPCPLIWDSWIHTWITRYCASVTPTDDTYQRLNTRIVQWTFGITLAWIFARIRGTHHYCIHLSRIAMALNQQKYDIGLHFDKAEGELQSRLMNISVILLLSGLVLRFHLPTDSIFEKIADKLKMKRFIFWKRSSPSSFYTIIVRVL